LSQAVRLFYFVEEENAMTMLGQNFSQPSGVAGSITHKQLYAVQVEEFGHVEAEEGISAEKVAGEFQRELSLADSCGAEEEERTERLVVGLQPELAACEHRTDSGNGMLFTFNFGKEVRFEGIEFIDVGIHGFSMGLIFLPQSHWRRA